MLTADFAKCFPGGPVIHGRLRLPTDDGAVTVLFGPSGSGKTTVLRCLAGLDRPDKGHIFFGEEIWFDAERRFHLPPQNRRLGYLAQDYALFPHLNVAANIAFGLGGLTRTERDRRVGDKIALFGLTGLEDRYPRQLSGGQQQRVALARALARRPRLLLLDEPLSALDAPTREQLRRQLQRWLADLGVPTLLVTHDRIEAFALADAVVLMDEGRILQTGPVLDVFARPANLAAAHILGVETIEPGRVLEVVAGLATVAVGDVRLFAAAGDATGGCVCVCIRAEDVILERGAGPCSAANRLPGRIRGIMREGALVRVSVDCGFPLTALVTHQTMQELGLQKGNRLSPW